MDSPRGRIVLMRVGHEEGAELVAEMVAHLDRCLGCMACVTACPSGVQYDQLIEQTRAADRAQRRPAAAASARYRARDLRAVHPPGRLRALAPLLALQQRLGLADALARAARASASCSALLALAPRRAGARRVRGCRERDRRRAASARADRAHAGLRPARVLRRRQRGHRAVLAAEGCEVHAPRAAALLRRAADARRRRGRGARAGARDDRRATRTSTRRRQRRRLRLGDEGLRAPARRRPRVGRARRGVRAKVRDVNELLAELRARAPRRPLR